MKKKLIIFAIVGAILGIPMSYFFQNELVRTKVGGIGGYISHLGDIAKETALLSNVILSVVIFALVGGAIGYFVDRKKVEKKD